ncbi:MAG: N(G),N(G)-dimethylarginine dimethylaminohydrolase [Microbacteriaceae bacterium]|nr:N(G),N(G)-dimethylarginine dimethylaminohydrolase [Microbacteriaceae bacterium]
MSTALVRPTSLRLAEGQLTHLERVEVDIGLAQSQWDSYCDTLATWGFEPVRVPGDDDLPDQVFVEDAVVVFDSPAGRLAVITSPGAESRRGETDAVAETLHTLGVEHTRIDLPGTLDGGDVLKVGDTVYVGRGGRTNAEGIRQLRELLTPRGFTVVGVPVTKVLHLKSAVTALPDGTVIGHPDDVDEPGIFPRFLPVPEHGAAVVVLAPDTVLMAASVPRSAELVESLGYRVVTVDVSEFEKLEGCVTCLSVRLR